MYKRQKYGNPVGHATAEISAGSWIHTHNLKTGLGDFLTYTYNKTITGDRKSTRLNSSHLKLSRMPSSA